MENPVSSMQDPDPAPQSPADELLCRPPSGAKRVRYDDEDDFDVGPRRSMDHNASSAGMVGFIFAAVAIGLFAVVLVLWIFLDKEEVQMRNPDRRRWMLYWFMFLDVLSFFAALTAVVMGGRGLAPSNPLYRGWAMTALILGILELVGTVIFFFVMTCVVLLFEIGGG
jgi:hypothetical protein